MRCMWSCFRGSYGQYAGRYRISFRTSRYGMHCYRYGVAVSGPKLLKGIEVNMSDFSDQALTLAAIAPFTDTGVTIRGIGHIRNQESDRIQAMYNELTKMGITCTQYDDGISIMPGVVKPCLVDTYNDHRVAMAFSL